MSKPINSAKDPDYEAFIRDFLYFWNLLPSKRNNKIEAEKDANISWGILKGLSNEMPTEEEFVTRFLENEEDTREWGYKMESGHQAYAICKDIQNLTKSTNSSSKMDPVNRGLSQKKIVNRDQQKADQSKSEISDLLDAQSFIDELTKGGVSTDRSEMLKRVRNFTAPKPQSKLNSEVGEQPLLPRGSIKVKELDKVEGVEKNLTH
jgi:hypothetical protein